MKSKNTFTLLLFTLFFQISIISFAQEQTPLDVALRYLEDNQKVLRLSPEDLKHYQVNDLYSSRHNGLTHVYLNQTHQDVKVLNAIINVNILPDGKVLNVGNRFISNLAEKVNEYSPAITPTAALQKVITTLGINNEVPLQLQTKINEQSYVFDPTGLALDPITVKLVYQKMEDKTVRLAWMVQLYQLDAQHWWNARVDAKSGEILAHHDQVIHCDFGKPGESCTDHNHQQGVAQKDWTPPTGPSNNSVLLNSYNVFPMPVQAPSFGDRALITAPADVTASPFGWHDTDGVDGAEYTITRGNNVHAYHDIFDLNASSGDEPEGGATLDFDFPLDLSTAAPYTQIDPAVTNLFYWNNIIHDLWYQYGFDEASGNFQVNNYGNGGIGGDYVRAEALDGGGTNNANFGSAEDGSNARMQMYIWTDDPLPPGGGTPDLIVTAPDSIAGNYPMQQGGFGGPLPTPGITSVVVMVDDTIGVSSDACEPIVNGADINGFIAMIDRGDCEFGAKSLAAENEGAIAVIICNNVPGGTVGMGGGAVGDQVTIPAVMISMEDCAILRMSLPGLTVTIEGGSVDIPMPGPSGVDGDFDNGIIAHEYGHGISNRLTGGPSTGGCLNSAEQAGEGWSDWFALVMSTDASNTAEEVRGVGTYALMEPTNGNGIREYPYSRDMAIDPHTYGDVPNVIAPHGVGSVWCVMIWDLYWNLVDEYGFDDDIYNGTGGNNIAMQLVMDGMKLQSCSPSFLDSRDGILAADEANNEGVNKCLIWETFARRGLGWSASPGGIEAFDTPPFCTPIQVIKTAAGEVTAGETLTYTLEIINNLPTLISNISITDDFPDGTSYVEGSLSCANGSVSGGVLTIDIGDLAPNNSITCTYELIVDAMPFSYVEFEDGVENGIDSWAVSSPIGAATWETNNNSYEGDLAWFAADIDTESDQYLDLAAPINLPGNNPAVTFWHWYDTEASWDGGVVEVSSDNGATWNDLGNNMIQNGYNSALQVNPASPISGQDAFNGNSNGYIQTIIDLSDYSGDDILIRFRLGCDGFVGGNGWYVDNIQFYGDLHSITNVACAGGGGTEESCDEATTIVFGGTTATNNPDNDLKVSISPNPTDGVFVLEMNSIDNSVATIQVMNVDGRLLEIRTIDHSNGAFEFDVSDYESGIYLLQIQTERAMIVKKVVVQ